MTDILIYISKQLTIGFLVAKLKAKCALLVQEILLQKNLEGLH
jgi:hypothetical protein